MGNIQSVWILYGVSLTLNFLYNNVKKIAVERQWITETAKINKIIYF